jgi:drug/metabolite transporter (DMT)-like permease
MKSHGEVRDFRPGAIRRVAGRVLRNWRLTAALACYAVAFFTFMRLMSIAPVSFAVPATAVSYVIETVLAKYVLKERVTWRRWAGAALVASGVALLGL